VSARDAGLQRLTADMLTQCAAELRLKTQECEDLKLELANMRARLNIYDAKVARLEAVLAEEAALAVPE
jgi:hypothetical protein